MKNILFFLCLTLSCLTSLYSQVNDSIDFDDGFNYINPVNGNLNPLNTQLLGEPRTPLKSSFYNEEMSKYDWKYQQFSRFIDPVEYTLHGLQSKIKTNGKVIVYDASVTSITDNAILTKNGIEVFQNEIFVSTADKTLKIPIKYLGDNSINPNSISKGEKLLISEYVNKSLAYSGITPSSINLTAKNGDFNIYVSKSNFTNEDLIVEGYNIRSRVAEKELFEEINKNLKSVDLEKTKQNLDIAADKFPQNKELDELRKWYNELETLNTFNSNSKTSISRLIQESPKEFVMHDGIRTQKKFEIQNKSDFIQDLVGSINNEINVIYLDVRGLGKDKSSAFIASTNIQIKKYRPDVTVKAMPKNETARKMFFNGQVLQKNTEIKPTIGEYSGLQTYNVKAEGKTWRIGLGLEVKPHIIKAKSKKLIKSFFKIFDKKVSNKSGWNLSDAVNTTRKDVRKKNKGIKDEDYDTFIRNELLGINIVFIEEIEANELLVISNNDSH